MKKINQHKEKIICFDFDGTITKYDIFPNINNDNINNDIKNLINNLYDKDFKIIINSARDTIYYSEIKDFLVTNNIKFHELHLKCKPIADIYIDDRGFLQNSRNIESFIESLFTSDIDDYMNIIANNSGTSLFLQNISNVPENPNYINKSDDNFRIILPLTGGMDSITLWNMLEESGEKYIPYYIDLGQEYAQLELDTIKKLTGIIPNIIKKDYNFKYFKHIINGRNAIIIMLLAEEFKKNNWWGEIWFGNLQGESPVINGDKSRRFFNDINALLINHDYDVRLMNPLIGMNKYDEVNYWKERDINILINTKSCFDANHNQCGKCQSCFRKYSAFKYHGIDISNTYDSINFDEHINKYINVMNESLNNNDFSKYSKDRIIKTLQTINLIKNE